MARYRVGPALHQQPAFPDAAPLQRLRQLTASRRLIPEQIVRAAKQANAHEFIEKMPEGYDTIVGERGATLSGGQRQRIAIARAVIRDAPILILDEPTTGLDSTSEEAVLEALDNLMEGKTSIVVAHHLNSIRHADVVFVIKDSELVEQGTHDELMAADGVYSELFKTQSSGSAGELRESTAAK